MTTTVSPVLVQPLAGSRHAPPVGVGCTETDVWSGWPGLEHHEFGAKMRVSCDRKDESNGNQLAETLDVCTQREPWVRTH